MKNFFLLIITLFFIKHVNAQFLNPVSWSYAARKTDKNEAIIYLKATIDRNWHIYSVNQPSGGPLKTSIFFNKSNEYSLIGRVVEQDPISEFEKVFNINVYYFKDSVVFHQRIRFRRPVTEVKGKVKYMACTISQCTPPLEIEFTVPIK